MWVIALTTMAFSQAATIDIDPIRLAGSALDRTGSPSTSCAVVVMSADGQVVVGYGTPVSGSRTTGFTWTKKDGVKPLSWPKEVAEAFSFCMATSISDDGRVVAGMALWMASDSAIHPIFKRAEAPTTVLGKFPLSDGKIGPINSDGRMMVVEVESAIGSKLFWWRSGSGLSPILGKGKQRLTGTISDLTPDGKVAVGATFKEPDWHGFVVTTNSYREIPKLSGFKSAIATHVTADGRTVFGYFDDIDTGRGFRWNLSESKPNQLPSGFALGAVTNNGEVVAGTYKNQPALLFAGRVIGLRQLFSQRLPQESFERWRPVAARKTKTDLFILVDTGSETTDYRIRIPLTILKRL